MSTARTRSRGSRWPVIIGLWTVALAGGFWLVLARGGPVTPAADALAEAHRPATPVTAEAARQSADTIVRLDYPDFQGIEPEARIASDFGIDRHILVYSRPEILSGVRVSIEVATGDVQVTTFP